MDEFIVVTGALGFIGTNLVRALNARGLDNLILVDHLGNDDKWKNIRTLNFEEYYDRRTFLNLLENEKLGPIKTIRSPRSISRSMPL